MQPTPPLEDILAAIPTVKLDVRYATANNFTGTKLYKDPVAWLHADVLEQLVAVAAELATQNLTIAIFDAYRPVCVQEQLKQFCDDTDYVAEVSNHCRGITIDMTIVDQNNVYLDMGTDYDDFSPKAHAHCIDLTEEQLNNRRLLREIMNRFGFVQHPNEWWHFDYKPDLMWPILADEQNALQSSQSTVY